MDGIHHLLLVCPHLSRSLPSLGPVTLSRKCLLSPRITGKSIERVAASQIKWQLGPLFMSCSVFLNKS